MFMSVQHTAVGLEKPRPSEMTEDVNLLQEALKGIEELFNFRLVDKIARPRDASWKQGEIDSFGKKMKTLHEKLYKIRSELTETRPTDSVHRNKSILGTATHVTLTDWKKYIKLIEIKYNEVLIDGSFKHARRICEVLTLKFLPTLEIIDIEEWADECLESKSPDKCCCC